MNSYFKPLRRKIGLGTLMLACVFTTCWVRSMTVDDFVYFKTSEHTSRNVVLNHKDFLASSRHGLIWIHNLFCNPRIPGVISFGPFFLVTDPTQEFFNGLEIPPYWFSFKRGAEPCGFSLFIPYWSIVLPLTVLSMWLLISTPKQAKPATEPNT